MINALDRQKNFLRPGFTLTSALEAFLDPLVTILSLLACLALFDQPVSARYTILGVIAFSLSAKGLKDLKLSNIAPTRTAKNLRRDVNAIKEATHD